MARRLVPPRRRGRGTSADRSLPPNPSRRGEYQSPFSPPDPMADLSTKKDPLHLRDERPDYVHDTDGMGNKPDSDEDVSEEVQPSLNTDPQDAGSLGVKKPTVTLDDEAVRKAEAEGKGYQ